MPKQYKSKKRVKKSRRGGANARTRMTRRYNMLRNNRNKIRYNKLSKTKSKKYRGVGGLVPDPDRLRYKMIMSVKNQLLEELRANYISQQAHDCLIENLQPENIVDYNIKGGLQLDTNNMVRIMINDWNNPCIDYL